MTQESTSWLERLIAPISRERFVTDYFEKKPLVVHREQADYFADVLTLDEIDRMITTFQLAHPDVSMVDATRQVRSSDYTYANGVIDVARLYERYFQGATIIMNQIERYLPAVSALCRALERDLTTRFQANVYLTPRQEQGLRTHYDSHDVIVLQVHGVKHWRIYDTPIELPFRGQSFSDHPYQPGQVTMEFDMRPGDTLYLPRGVMHDAASQGNDSLHVTIGVLHTSWTELFLEAVARVGLRDPEFRRSLPLGFARPEADRAQLAKEFHRLASRLVEQLDVDAAVDHFADELVSTRQSLLRGQLDQIRRLHTVTESARAGVRANLLYRVRRDAEHVTVSCYAGEIRFPIHAADALEFALAHDDFDIRDLPGDLDDAGKLVLVKRLVREGVLRLL
jgi:ribosomal protein L16 Arg81 hydroxylase